MNEEILRGFLVFPFPLIGFLLGGILMFASMNFRQFYAGLAVIAVTACLYFGGGISPETQFMKQREKTNVSEQIQQIHVSNVSLKELLPDGELETPSAINARVAAIFAELESRKAAPKGVGYAEKLESLSEEDLNKLLEAEKNKLIGINDFMKRLIEERGSKKIDDASQDSE